MLPAEDVASGCVNAEKIKILKQKTTNVVSILTIPLNVKGLDLL